MIIVSPLRGTVISIEVRAGDAVSVGQTLAVLESMKMEHPVLTHRAGVVSDVQIAVGDTVVLDEVLFELAVGDAAVALAGTGHFDEADDHPDDDAEDDGISLTNGRLRPLRARTWPQSWPAGR